MSLSNIKAINQIIETLQNVHNKNNNNTSVQSKWGSGEIIETFSNKN